MVKPTDFIFAAALPILTNMAFAGGADVPSIAQTDGEHFSAVNSDAVALSDVDLTVVRAAEIKAVLESTGLTNEQITEVLNQFHVEHVTIEGKDGSVCRGGP